MVRYVRTILTAIMVSASGMKAIGGGAIFGCLCLEKLLAWELIQSAFANLTGRRARRISLTVTASALPSKRLGNLICEILRKPMKWQLRVKHHISSRTSKTSKIAFTSKSENSYASNHPSLRYSSSIDSR
jgi:hypothetical protein